MRYEDTITLTKQGNSRCLVIPSKWLKLNNMERLKYAVDIIIEDGQITLQPTKSRYMATQLSKDTVQSSALINLPSAEDQPPVEG